MADELRQKPAPSLPSKQSTSNENNQQQQDKKSSSTPTNRRHRNNHRHHRGGGHGGTKAAHRQQKQMKQEQEQEEEGTTNSIQNNQCTSIQKSTTTDNKNENTHSNFIESLTALNHPDPKSALLCFNLPPKNQTHRNKKKKTRKGHERRRTDGDGEQEKEEAVKEEVVEQVEENDGDDALESLVIWLEDHVIRQWDPKSRKEKLESTKNFWSSIQNYLFDLDCPPMYYINPNEVRHKRNDKDGKEFNLEDIEENKISTSTYWKNDSGRRQWVIYWIISCAVSQLYEDYALAAMENDLSNLEKKDKTELLGQDDEKKMAPTPLSTQTQKEQEYELVKSSTSAATVSAAATTVTTPENTNSKQHQSQWNQEAFPLGFTTNDNEVDQICTMLRMRYILQLRNVQNEMNDEIANLQSLHFE